MRRRLGISVRMRLTLVFAGFLLLTAAAVLTIVWFFLLRYVPVDSIDVSAGFVPNRGDLQRAFVPAVVAGMLFVVGAGLVGGWLIAGRMLAPLNSITAATRRAARGSLSHRIRMPGRQDEFRELADAFDDMLGRIERHVAEQGRFAANASHELRTPLAITQTMLEVAANDPDGPSPELIERLRIVNRRTVELTEALLTLSKADRGVSERFDVDLSLAVEESAETLLPFAEERRITVELGGGPSVAVGSPALLQQLVTNLLHNAIVHNVDGGRLTVTTGSDADVATLRVANTGRPLEQHALPQLLEPFQRGSGRVRAGDGGAGLGLAIVDSITRAHGGQLRLEAPATGGLIVELRLPSGARGQGRAQSASPLRAPR